MPKRPEVSRSSRVELMNVGSLPIVSKQVTVALLAREALFVFYFIWFFEERVVEFDLRLKACL